jgi:hypothetical protein
MATAPGVNPGKTKFAEEFFSRHRDADEAAVNRAWTEAGHEGDLSESLVYKVRAGLGLTGRRGANGGPSGGKKVASPAKGKGKSSNGAKGKRASKVEEPVPETEAQDGGTGPSRSSFVEEVLGREPESNLKAVNQAWSAAGHEGSISPSIYYKVKRERGLAGERSSGGPTSAGASRSEASEGATVFAGRGGAPQPSNGREAAAARSGGTGPVEDRERLVDEVEAGIDHLMFTLKSNGGMPEVEAALRAARRLLTRNGGGGE